MDGQYTLLYHYFILHYGTLLVNGRYYFLFLIGEMLILDIKLCMF